MARSKPQEITEDAAVDEVPVEQLDVSTAPSDWEWETVAAEAGIKVIFDEIGDTFVGQYKGIDHITPDNGKDDPFDLLAFIGRDGQRYSLNTSYKLNEAMTKVKPDDWCRITYVKDIPSSQPQPMKDFRVEVRKV